jgi:hypothetical protein
MIHKEYRPQTAPIVSNMPVVPPARLLAATRQGVYSALCGDWARSSSTPTTRDSHQSLHWTLSDIPADSGSTRARQATKLRFSSQKRRKPVLG